MHFHLPKPLHGWRDFTGEVGIIVIGVLIALAAEQVVEAAHWRSEVRHFREAVDYELGRDLGVWALMMEQRPCVARRLDDLDRLLAASTSGHSLKLLRPIDRPASYSSYYSVWDNKGADVTGYLPLKVRLRYGELYDELHNQDVVRLSEREVWRDLARFDQPEPLDHQDRMLMRELLTRARQLDEAERGNAGYIAGIAAPLGIRPIADPDQPHLSSENSFCRPLIAK
jgi:hypothetical protein